MPIRLVDSPSEYPNSHRNTNITTNNTPYQDQAGTATQQNGHAGSGATTTSASTGGNERTDAINPGSAPSPRRLTKEEADRLYEENIEEEYAKREGGA
jgi:hypothetical protein